RAEKADPANANVPLSLAFTMRALQDVHGELAALTRALVIDPHFIPALMAKAMLLERTGQIRQAAKLYGVVVALAPAEAELMPEMRSALAHAGDVVRDNVASLETHLKDRLAAVKARHRTADFGRFDECKDVVVGTKRIYTQEPSMLHF